MSSIDVRNSYEKATSEKSSHSKAKSESILNEISMIIQKWVGEQVTWVAIAAIGGVLIAIWNFLRYFFTFLSSFFKHLQTNVPIYLLMNSKDHGITDVRLFFSTIIMMIIILSFVYIDPFSEKFFTLLSNILFYYLWIVVAFLLVTYIDRLGMFDSIHDSNSSIIFDNNSIANVIDDFYLVYILSALCMYECTILGRKYYYTRKKYFLTKKNYFSLHDQVKHLSNEYSIIKKNLEQNIKEESEESIDSKHALQEIKKTVTTNLLLQKDMIKRIRSFEHSSNMIIKIRLMIIIPIVFIIILDTYYSPYYLIDQYNRIIVADLGEQYVVQEAIIDDTYGHIAIDTSNFYIVNSVNETLRVSNYKLNKLSTMNIDAERENEITIGTLGLLIGKEKKDIPFDIGKCNWCGRVYFETTDNIYLYGNKGKVIFEINGGLLIRAFWVSYTLHMEVSDQNEELNRLINLISETTGLEKEVDLDEDEVTWTDMSKNINYYINYHESPLIIGVNSLTQAMPYFIIH